MNEISFGYPMYCEKCESICGRQLRVRPFYKTTGQRGVRVMLVGQDPTVFKRPEVLMLDKENGQLMRWLKGLFGDSFNSVDIYATNIVKCRFNSPPSTQIQGGLEFLTDFFKNCSNYLVDEIKQYQPDLLLTLGEPTHKLFCTLLEDNEVPISMKDAFDGRFRRVKVSDWTFNYSPCLHIKTFRVAETYGKSVLNFKWASKSYLGE